MILFNQYQVKLTKWINYINRKEERDIINWLYDEGEHRRSLIFECREYPKLKALYTLMKSSYYGADEECVMKALADEHNYDLSMARFWISNALHKKLHDDIKIIIQRLYDAHKCSEKALKMKDKVPNLEVNDFARLSRRAAKILKNRIN